MLECTFKPGRPEMFFGGVTSQWEVDSWLSAMKIYLQLTRVEPTLQVLSAASYLRKDAMLWYSLWSQEVRNPTWNEFEMAFKDEYYPLGDEDHMIDTYPTPYRAPNYRKKSQKKYQPQRDFSSQNKPYNNSQRTQQPNLDSASMRPSPPKPRVIYSKLVCDYCNEVGHPLYKCPQIPPYNPKNSQT